MVAFWFNFKPQTIFKPSNLWNFSYRKCCLWKCHWNVKVTYRFVTVITFEMILYFTNILNLFRLLQKFVWDRYIFLHKYIFKCYWYIKHFEAIMTTTTTPRKRKGSDDDEHAGNMFIKKIPGRQIQKVRKKFKYIFRRAACKPQVKLAYL